VLLLLLGLPVSCDDDDNGTAPDASAQQMCVGQTFGRFTRASLGSAVATGMCGGSADLDVICRNDVGVATRECGSGCYLQNPGAGEAALVTCTNACVNMRIMPNLSAGCQSCYTASVLCTAANCAAQCAADPNTPACQACQVQRGCLPAFFGCSGLPAPPTGGGADGGTPAQDAATGG
jgi:hypothetical protein